MDSEFDKLAQDLIECKSLKIDFSIKKKTFKTIIFHPWEWDSEMEEDYSKAVKEEEHFIRTSPSPLLTRTKALLEASWRENSKLPTAQTEGLSIYYGYSNHDKGRDNFSRKADPDHRQTIHLWEPEVKRPYEGREYFEESLRVPLRGSESKLYMAIPLAEALLKNLDTPSYYSDNLVRLIGHCRYHALGENKQQITGNVFLVSNYYGTRLPITLLLDQVLQEIELAIPESTWAQLKAGEKKSMRFWLQETYLSIALYAGIKSDPHSKLKYLREVQKEYKDKEKESLILKHLEEYLG